MRNRGALVTIVVSLGVALLLVLLSAAPPNADGDPSSRSAGRAGTLALYQWLSGLGFSTDRVSDTFTLDGRDVLIVSQPTAAITADDASAVMSLLDGGGDLILAVDSESAPQAVPLLQALQVSLDVVRPAGSSTPAEPFDAGDRVHSVPMAAGLGIDPAPYLAPLLNQGPATTAVAETVGQGRAYVVASPFPLSNDGLRDGDSAMLVLSLLERARGGHIGFDEYHHGEQASAPSGASAIFDSPLGLALLLGVAAVVLILGVRGRRLGPPMVAGGVTPVPTTASYIESMAALFARSDDRGAVAARYASELRAQLGDASPASDDDVVRLVTDRRPELAARVAAALADARRLAASKPTAAQLLALAREVDDIEAAWSEPVPAEAGSAQ